MIGVEETMLAPKIKLARRTGGIFQQAVKEGIHNKKDCGFWSVLHVKLTCGGDIRGCIANSGALLPDNDFLTPFDVWISLFYSMRNQELTRVSLRLS
jgi:hypothetical protein